MCQEPTLRNLHWGTYTEEHSWKLTLRNLHWRTLLGAHIKEPTLKNTTGNPRWRTLKNTHWGTLLSSHFFCYSYTVCVLDGLCVEVWKVISTVKEKKKWLGCSKIFSLNYNKIISWFIFIFIFYKIYFSVLSCNISL